MSNLFRFVVVALALAVSSPALAACSKPGNAGEMAKEMVQMTNQFRNRLGLGQVRTSQALTKAAATFACELAATGNFSHVGQNGSNVKSRVTNAGYGRACLIAENLAWGYEGTQVVMTGWEGSPKHRANLMQRKAKEIGIAVAYRGTTPYWVMVLASKC